MVEEKSEILELSPRKYLEKRKNLVETNSLGVEWKNPPRNNQEIEGRGQNCLGVALATG
jgi:hypothetical protein